MGIYLYFLFSFSLPLSLSPSLLPPTLLPQPPPCLSHLLLLPTLFPLSLPLPFFYPEFDCSNLTHLFVIHTPSTLPTPNLEPLLHPLMNEAKHHNVINISIGSTDLLNSEGPMLYNVLSFLVFNGKWHSDKNISIYHC